MANKDHLCFLLSHSQCITTWKSRTASLCSSSGRGRKCNPSSPLPRFCWISWVWQSSDLCRFLPWFYSLLRARVMNRWQKKDKHNRILPWMIKDHFTHKHKTCVRHKYSGYRNASQWVWAHALNTPFPLVWLNGILNTDLCEWYTAVVSRGHDHFTQKYTCIRFMAK